MPMTPIPPFPALSDRANGTYNGKAFDWASHMANTFVTEVNALAANLNSIAAGGAYAIPFTWGTTGASGSVGGVAGGRIGTDSSAATQNAATTLYVDILSAAGLNVSGLLDSFMDSSSLVKGYFRIQKVSDPSRFLLFRITALAGSQAYYRAYTIAAVGNYGSPFSVGDSVMLFFDRTGDKGDKGDNGTSLTPMIHVREESAAGAGPATSVSQNTWVKRAFNTVRTNSVTGASLASGQITLPAGTYDYEGNAAGTGCAQHQARLVNVTDNIVASELGTTEYTDSSITTRSVVTGRFVLASTKVFELQHRASSASGSFGSSVNNFGSANVHAEIKLTKVA